MSELDEFLTALEEPFPALTDLNLYTIHNAALDPVSLNPTRFLDGSTHLRSLSLTGISIPGLQKLLLSFTDLVNLRPNYITLFGYFPPHAMVTALSAPTRLKVLHFGLEYYQEKFNRLHPPPPRAILPSLTALKFEGASEYLEDFVARIDVLRFISRIPKLRAHNKARIVIDTTGRNFRIHLWQPPWRMFS
jgi:hypothetical protein